MLYIHLLLIFTFRFFSEMMDIDSAFWETFDADLVSSKCIHKADDVYRVHADNQADPYVYW